MVRYPEGNRYVLRCHPERSEGSMHFQRRSYYVYIMTNRSKTLYTGVTNNIARRVIEDKAHVCAGFTNRYQIDRLVYCERFSHVRAAIAREKQIKGLLRVKKMALIVSMNPEWTDLAEDWGKSIDPSASPRSASG